MDNYIKQSLFVISLIIPPLRKRVNRQLNKGEQIHNLRLFLRFRGDGFIRKQQETEQQVSARSLTLLTNIVIAWNTIYIQEILKELKEKGECIKKCGAITIINKTNHFKVVT